MLIKQFCVDLQIITLVRLPIGGDALTWWEVYSTRLETNISRSIYSNTRKNHNYIIKWTWPNWKPRWHKRKREISVSRIGSKCPRVCYWISEGNLSCWVLICVILAPRQSTKLVELWILGFDDAGFKAMLMEK